MTSSFCSMLHATILTSLLSWFPFPSKSQTRVRLEEKRIERLQRAVRIQKMEKDFDVNAERECRACFYDLHISSASCNCSPDRFTCLKHANLITCCDPENRLVLLRHPIIELKTLVAALEDCMLAQEVWASGHHGGHLGPKNLSDSILASDNKLLGIDPLPSSVPSVSSMKNEYIEDLVYADSDPERRTNFGVEAVNLGSIVHGKLWSNKETIFPNGTSCLKDSPMNIIFRWQYV